MLSLTRLFLHNWHRFQHHILEVEDSLYLAGHNGSGKSSVLDAIQLVLVADQTRVQFNKSAQEQSDRSLDTYVRGKLGEDRWLRPGNTVGVVAMEFRDGHRPTAVTVGVCLDAAPGKPVEKLFFILPEALDPALFAPDGQQARSRRALREELKRHAGARYYDHVHEYQADLLNRLGGLNDRFFDLFLRALHFKPISRINDFVEQWLLEKKDLNLDTLQTVRERLRDLKGEAERVEARIAALDRILAQQREVLRLTGLHDQYHLLAALLRAEAAHRQLEHLNALLKSKQTGRERASAELIQIQSALHGAEIALKDASRRLYESDVIRRRDELDRDLRRLQGDIREIHARWRSVSDDLRVETAALQPSLAAPDLEPGEAAALQSWHALASSLTPDQGPPAGLNDHLDALLPLLGQAFQRVTERRVRLTDRLHALRERGQTLQREIENLQKQGAIPYPREVARMQDRLRPLVGGRPKLLCELLEVTDPHWQNAVEAMLGRRRFNLVVAPEHFRAAARELDQARAEERLYDVGLIDLAAAQRSGRPAQPGSLATLVQAPTEAVRAYIDTVLGDIIACDSVDELNRHRRAVTSEVVTYGEFTVRAVRPEAYTPNFIGQKARQSQIEARQRELETIGRELADLAPEVQATDELAKTLNRQAQLAALRERLNARLDARDSRQELAELQAQRAALDLTGVAALEEEVQRLETLVKRQRDDERQAVGDIARLVSELEAAARERDQAQRAAGDRAAEIQALYTQRPEAQTGAEELFLQRRQAPDLPDEIRKAEHKAKEFETRGKNETEALIELGTAYNRDYQFSANARDPRDRRYPGERERLLATDLPSYRERIEQAEREADHELREHVLHTLREQIAEARRKLNLINDGLSQLDFGPERYRFRAEPAEDAREFYDLITADSQLLGRGSLFESQFYQEHQAAFDRFYEALTRKPQSELDRREQDRLTDYRRYLNYDILVIEQATGRESRLSRIMNQTSGGETQTPFYLTIAASFVQLYRLQDRTRRPTIRLVAFDEAFSKMDQDRIGATLDLFHKFNLQIITATPLERCEYLAPKICTSLVLTAVRDTVHIEPYRNYAVRLIDSASSTSGDDHAAA